MAQAIRPDSLFEVGDKVIAITRTECSVQLHQQLIGDEPTPELVGQP